MKGAVLFAATGFSAIANAAIATINPCPSCPPTAAPAPITVTSQYQPVSTCTPLQVCTTDTSDVSATSASLTCKIEPDCTTYDFVSTVIPFLAGSSSTTVTEIDAIVTLDHTSTVLTSLIPITTRAPVFNGTLAIQNGTYTNYTLTRYETLVIDTYCPYNQLGPIAIPGYGGSGLCKACTADPNVLSQVVTVRDCHDNSTCATTIKTWISKLPIKTSTTQVSVSTQTSLPSGGTYVIPVVTVCPPADNHYNPVTKSFAVTTAVYYPTIVHITKIVDITFIGHPAPTASTTLSECPLSTSTYCPTNVIHTIPMYTTIYPTLPGYGSPIIIDIDYTITVINAPTFIFPTTIIIVTLTSNPETVTVISGTTVTAPVTTTVTTTASQAIDPVPASETTGVESTDTFSTDGPTETFSTVESTGTFSTDEPTETSTIIDSTVTFSTDGPSDTISTVGPTDTISTDGPTDTISSGEPTESASTDIPVETTTAVDSETSTFTFPPETTPNPGPSSTTDVGPDGTTTVPPTISSDPPLPLEAFDAVGCLGSSGGFPTFEFQFADPNMTPELCANSCRRDGLAYSGLYTTECYCAATLGTQTDETTTGACNIPCPGNPLLTCGGNRALKLRVRDVDPSKLLDVYVYTPIAPTTTTSSSSTSTTMDNGPSDGPDPEPEPRSLNADMELNNYKHRVRKLRRGGMLRGEKKSNANLRVKRDFGMRNPFGL